MLATFKVTSVHFSLNLNQSCKVVAVYNIFTANKPHIRYQNYYSVSEYSLLQSTECNLPFSCESGTSEPSYSGGQTRFFPKEHSVLLKHGRWKEREPWTGTQTHGDGRTSRSVVMRTRLEPERNSLMIKSLSFWSMSPCWKTKNVKLRD